MKFKNVNRFETNCIKYDSYPEHTLSYTIADSDYKVAKPIQKALKKRINHGIFGYTNEDKTYKELYCKFISRRYSYQVEPENIIIGNGVVHALKTFFKYLLPKNSHILIQKPVYSMFDTCIQFGNQILINSELKYDGLNYTIDFIDLADKLKKADAFLFCNPHNPVGRVWSADDIKKIVLLCKENNVLLISDEIHCDLILFNHVFTSVGHFQQLNQNMIILTAPSKTFNLAGLFYSHIICFNEKLTKKIESIYENCIISEHNILGETAAIAAYTDCDSFIEKQNQYLEKNFIYLKKYLEHYLPDIIITPLEATFLVWINLCNMNIPTENIKKELLQRGVAIQAGSSYGSDTFIRFNIACNIKTLHKGLKIFVEVIQDLQK